MEKNEMEKNEMEKNEMEKINDLFLFKIRNKKGKWVTPIGITISENSDKLPQILKITEMVKSKIKYNGNSPSEFGYLVFKWILTH